MSTENSTIMSEAVSSAGASASTQYLVVACNVTRVVTVDGKNVGRTDEVLELPPGDYTVSLLAPPANFRPKYRRVSLQNTSAAKPLVIRFETR